MKAPYPYFGGKSRIATLVWDRFGDVPNFIDPFFGSGAILLGRTTEPKIETVNDLDGFICNFWRALQADPDAVAAYADWPVIENDKLAREAWLVGKREMISDRLDGDPDWYDTKIAGWWVWGISCNIGGGFCSGAGPWHAVDGRLVRTEADGRGVERRLPHLGNAGRGVNRKRPHLGGAWSAGRGVNRPGQDLLEYMRELAHRMRRVRVCCGDWTRVCGPTPTFKLGLTAVFLDPPYSAEAGRDMRCYRVDSGTVAHAVREWAIEAGRNPLMRVALCGYEGEHVMPDDWDCVAWKAKGGYGSQGNGAGKANAHRERVWFSPACIKPGGQSELLS